VQFIYSFPNDKQNLRRTASCRSVVADFLYSRRYLARKDWRFEACENAQRRVALSTQRLAQG